MKFMFFIVLLSFFSVFNFECPDFIIYHNLHYYSVEHRAEGNESSKFRYRYYVLKYEAEMYKYTDIQIATHILGQTHTPAHMIKLDEWAEENKRLHEKEKKKKDWAHIWKSSSKTKNKEE